MVRIARPGKYEVTLQRGGLSGHHGAYSPSRLQQDHTRYMLCFVIFFDYREIILVNKISNPIQCAVVVGAGAGAVAQHITALR